MNTSNGRTADISLDWVTKRYGSTTILQDLDLDVPHGAFVVIVGPSGCGKSTTLRILAGLEQETSGRVHIGGRDVTEVPARDRNIAMVFQDFALYPHMTVEANIAFPLRLKAKHDRRKGPSRQEITQRVEHATDLLNIGHLHHRRPAQLSGGERQRVALARAIVRDPVAFLMDEPLSSLDAKLRVQTRAEILALHRRLRATVVYVTHDQVEAMTMATHLVVMDAGTVMQAGSPDDVYAQPSNTFTAGFIGSPPMNLLPSPHQAIPSPLPPDGLTVGWRPPHATLHSTAAEVDEPPDRGLRLRGTVSAAELLGEDVLVSVDGDWGSARILHPVARPRPATGDNVDIIVPRERLHWFDTGTGARIDPETSAVDTMLSDPGPRR